MDKIGGMGHGHGHLGHVKKHHGGTGEFGDKPVESHGHSKPTQKGHNPFGNDHVDPSPDRPYMPRPVYGIGGGGEGGGPGPIQTVYGINPGGGGGGRIQPEYGITPGGGYPQPVYGVTPGGGGGGAQPVYGITINPDGPKPPPEMLALYGFIPKG
jgi:hypothetical protein